MLDNKGTIKSLIDEIIKTCFGWIIKDKDGNDFFIDPNDQIEISAHYGATHAAASLILWGKYTDNQIYYDKGYQLLQSILLRWDESTKLPAYHFDFNNFALCLIENQVDEQTSKNIRDIICNTPDSNHATINWLPMRWFVNKKRNYWSKNALYEKNIEYCKETICQATNNDGGIEDRLPRGKSFNLQYDIATVALLQYLRINGENIEIGKELGFLINAIGPDGDINYQGRGCNQIFGWALWIYLLSTSKQKVQLKTALDFIKPKLQVMLKNNNLMLNEWEGKEKFQWWDYHYASVYISHCLLWLILSILDYEKKEIVPITPTTEETGLHIFKSENYFVCWFEGRTEYLAEKGPSISYIWSKEKGIITKGTFGPWQGAFGNNHIYEDITIKNYFGPLQIKKNIDWSKNRFIRRFFPAIFSKPFLYIKPVFGALHIEEKDKKLIITWETDKEKDITFNMPCMLSDFKNNVYIDKRQINVFHTEIIKNQYGWINIYSTHSFRSSKISIVI